MRNIVQHLRNNKYVVNTFRRIKKEISNAYVKTEILEIRKLECRFVDYVDNVRLNLLVPSLSTKNVFGGISTAITLFELLCKKLNCNFRIIVLDDAINKSDMAAYQNVDLVSWDYDGIQKSQIVDMSCRNGKTISVGKQDIFLATTWWSAYVVEEIIKQQAHYFSSKAHPLLYLIQDYEPGFYAWSSKYLLAESTYKLDVEVIAIFNSKLLQDYFLNKGYVFYKYLYFNPELNPALATELRKTKEENKRKKQILIYGRPGTARNAFEIIIEGLRRWNSIDDKANDWTIFSVGEKHKDIKISERQNVRSLGKLSLSEYSHMMAESQIGISLMVSPHPSYPPLEMATYGMRVITNSFENKDLSIYGENIISLKKGSPEELAKVLYTLCRQERQTMDVDYYTNDSHTLIAAADTLGDMLELE